MPRRRKSEDDEIFTALDALEDEVRAWRQIGQPRRPGDYVRLVRYPPFRLSSAIGPAEYTADTAETIEHVDIPENEIPFFLRYRGMKAAIKALREEA